MSNKRYVFSLTTIPSRIKYIDITIKSLIEQTLAPEKVILNLPKKYKVRFNTCIDIATIKKHLARYIDKIVINYVDDDYGPGTKLLGLFKNMMTTLDIKNTYIVLVDDDHVYKPYMLEHFDHYNKEHYNYRLISASYFCYQHNRVTIGQGSDGFFIRADTLNKFEDYYKIIKDYDFVKYHDDYYISYYFHIKKIPIDHIAPPHGETIYTNIEFVSKTDALLAITDKYNRTNLNYQVNKILSELNDNGAFNNEV